MFAHTWLRSATVIAALAVMVVMAPGRAVLWGQTDAARTFAELVARARANGSVRVIIELDTAVRPEGELLSQSAVDGQRATLRSAQASVLAALPAAVRARAHEYETIPFLALEADSATLAVLRSAPGVRRIAEDTLHEPSLLQSTPIVGAPTAWNQAATGAGWSVAVLDTGVDRYHPYFNGRVISEACYSTTSSSTFSLCPGRVSAAVGPASAAPCSYHSGCAHGTHVAGIAAGSSASSRGVAPDAGIIAVQVFSGVRGQGPGAFTSDIVRGLERVFALRAQLNIASVNMSLGGGQFFAPCDTDPTGAVFKAAIDQLRSVHIATVIASGNEGFVSSMARPACISTAVSVGSTGDGSAGAFLDDVSIFSNSASFLTLLAPGEWITSSITGGGFSTYEGTSMAAPHVAGAWAVLRSGAPWATLPEVLDAVVAGGLPITDWRNGITKPRLRVDVSLLRLIWGYPTSRTPTITTVGDYNGDGLADFASYRAGSGVWEISHNGGSVAVSEWGAPALQDRPVARDYDGDGRIDRAVYRESTGTWFILQSAAGGRQVQWGAAAGTDLPVPGDYDGDGRDDIAVFRFSTGQWFILNSTPGVPFTAVGWGAPSLGDIPVPGDYDGDGRTDIAVYRGSTGQWFIRRSASGTVGVLGFGAPALRDVPVPADYDGDGRTDLAVYRSTTGQWYISYSGGGDLSLGWGAPSLLDLPAPGDYDGDGRADVAVYRFVDGGDWYVRRSSNGSLLYHDNIVASAVQGSSIRKF